MLFADLRLESTTLGSIDPIPGENIRDGDTYGDGGDYQRGIQAVHAGSHEIRHLPVRCAWGIISEYRARYISTPGTIGMTLAIAKI